MKNKPLLVIFITVFIDLVGFGIIIPLSPFLARQFGADAVTIGWLMTVYSAMQFVFAPIWGRISDRWGRRPVILISLLGAGLAHLTFAFAQHLWLLFVARALAGLFGANISTAMAAIADVTTPENRSKGMGLVGAAFGLGFILGPALGGIFAQIGEHWGSQPPFGHSFAAVMASAICLANFALALRVLPESLPLERRRQIPERPSRLLGLLKYLRTPILGHLMVVFFLSSLAMAQIEQSLFLLVQDKFNWDLQRASFGFAYVGVVMVFTQGYLLRKVVPRWGEKLCLMVGLLGSAIGFFGIAFAEGIPQMALAVTFLGFGVGLSHPSITGSISLLASAHVQGESLGAHQSLAALARMIGPVTGGWLYQIRGQKWPFAIAGLLVLVAIEIAFAIRKSLPESGKKEL